MEKNILIADDDKNIIASLQYLLADQGFKVVPCNTPEEVIQRLTRDNVELVLMDMNFQRDTTSGREGIELVKTIRNIDYELPIMVMTGWATVDIAVEALKAGAQDFIQKPWNDDHLIVAIQTQLRASNAEKSSQRLAQQNRLLNEQQFTQNRQALIAESACMRALLEQLEALAQSDMNILLTGENGTGKSMLAHYVHQCSSRSHSPFVAVNMGAIPESLFESEMFGHRKGAFTDAKENRIGRFEMADGGTLFLDELANIPLAQQVKLLRVLEEKKYEKVGGNKIQFADVRIVSATNADLKNMIVTKGFRQDLYYRLNTVEIRIPPLKEREQDIIPLAQSFLKKYSQKYQRDLTKLSKSAQACLLNYHWPGNVRELDHMMERALFTSKNRAVDAQNLSIPEYTDCNTLQSDNHLNMTLDEIEKNVMRKRLEFYDGNVTATAQSLGLSRSGYYRRVNKYDLDQ